MDSEIGATRRSMLFGLLGTLASCAAKPASSPSGPAAGPGSPAPAAPPAPSEGSGPPENRAADSAPRVAPSANGSKTVTCVCAHPDDAESGCGGTLIRLKKEGYRVQVVYAFTGGITGKSAAEAKETRRKEAIQACKILGAEPTFLFDRLDAPRPPPKLEAAWVTKVAAVLRQSAPGMVFTHWPLDAHEDHQITSLLTVRAVSSLETKPDLYFFEVERGKQTFAFSPTVYVDITAVREAKLNALTEHESQDAWRLYEQDHEPMELFRGREAGVKAAEGFIPLRAGATELTRALK